MGTVEKDDSGKYNDENANKLKVSSFEDILEIVGTNGIRNYIMFFACGICKFDTYCLVKCL